MKAAHFLIAHDCSDLILNNKTRPEERIYVSDIMEMYAERGNMRKITISLTNVIDSIKEYPPAEQMQTFITILNEIEWCNPEKLSPANYAGIKAWLKRKLEWIDSI